MVYEINIDKNLKLKYHLIEFGDNNVFRRQKIISGS